MPKRVRELIGFLTMIIDTTTTNISQTLSTTNVRCFEKGCSGLIKTALRPDTGEIHWYCGKANTLDHNQPEQIDQYLVICVKFYLTDLLRLTCPAFAKRAPFLYFSTSRSPYLSD